MRRSPASWAASPPPKPSPIEGKGFCEQNAPSTSCPSQECPAPGMAAARRTCLHRCHCIRQSAVTGRDHMATLTIRNVDVGVKERLRVRAARHGRSREAEARSILSEAVAHDRDRPEPNLAEAIRRRFAPLGGVDLELPPDEFVGEPPSFDP